MTGRPWIFVVLALAGAASAGTFVDLDALAREKAMWEGMAETNKLISAEIGEVRREAERFEAMQIENIELKSRVEDLNEFIGGVLSNSFIEWTTADGKFFVARPGADDGEGVMMRLLSGNSGRVLRSKIAESDVRMLDLMNAQGLLPATAEESP